MKKLEIFLFAIILSILGACDKNESNTEEPLKDSFLFEDGFETQNNSIDELFPLNGNRWTTTQKSTPAQQQDTL